MLVSGAIDSRQSQDGTVRKGLAPAQGQRDHHIVTAADSHPDCRAVLIQITAENRCNFDGMALAAALREVAAVVACPANSRHAFRALAGCGIFM